MSAKTKPRTGPPDRQYPDMVEFISPPLRPVRAPSLVWRTGLIAQLTELSKVLQETPEMNMDGCTVLSIPFMRHAEYGDYPKQIHRPLSRIIGYVASGFPRSNQLFVRCSTDGTPTLARFPHTDPNLYGHDQSNATATCKVGTFEAPQAQIVVGGLSTVRVNGTVVIPSDQVCDIQLSAPVALGGMPSGVLMQRYSDIYEQEQRALRGSEMQLVRGAMDAHGNPAELAGDFKTVQASEGDFVLMNPRTIHYEPAMLTPGRILLSVM